MPLTTEHRHGTEEGRQAMTRFGWLMLLAVVLVLAQTAGADGEETEFTSTFELDDCIWSNVGGNEYFNLDPGTQSVLEGDDDGEEVVLQITALNAWKNISFRTPEGDKVKVKARIVEEREWVDDELAEVSRNYFARCRQTNDIYYFGEDVDIFEDGMVSHAGAWLAGKNGAQPGLIMPGTFLLGSRYFQEIAPGVALDRAEHTAMDLTVQVPFGVLDECVEIVETSPLDPPGHSSTKIYCPDVGLVIDDEAELTEHDSRHDDDD
jgi:hypothetical protein